jgi:FtsZ-interacting cell division protein YlmF
VSEYQYYEFQALDRPLTREQIAELRKLTSRATITPTRLVNVYHYGDFRGDPYELLERYFDAHVYVANWGSHQLLLDFPRTLLDQAAVEPYLVEGVLEVHHRSDRLILELTDEDEDGGGWVDDDEGSAWMGTLLPLRTELASGDLRPLYLAWLAGLRQLPDEEDDEEYDEEYETEADEEVDPERREPPVPAGLAKLSAAQQGLIEFLNVDPDLVAVAAERSVARPSNLPDQAALAHWIADLPTADKDALLLRLMRGEAQLQSELLRRFRADTAPTGATANPGPARRTVRELRAAAAERATARQRAEMARAAEEARRLAEERARLRAAHLASLTGQEERLWQQVEALVNTKKPRDYDESVKLLTDLRDLAERDHQQPAYQQRLYALRARHDRKPSWLERLDRAKLR